MGSELAIGDRSVWVSLLQLVRGGLADLHVDAAGVRPLKPVERYYGRICAHLERTHQVIPFAYDWRIDIGSEADRLAEAVRAQLAITRPQNQPIRFLAHSMGGLVTRAMIARHPQVWRDVCEHPDARFIMLGTPNGGSHAIPELLVGQSVVFRKLARLDVRHRAETLLDVIGRFPGILAMLPEVDDRNLFSARTWQEFHDRAGAGWLVPDEARLKAAREIRQTIADSPIDPARMIYVAGSSDVTVAAMRLEQRPGETRDRIVFMGTTRGDGRVTWDSGIPKALSSAGVYYMDVQHGDMAADEPSFPAVEELLTRGETRLLPRTPPVAREAAVMFEMPRAEDDRYPDADDLAAAVIGAGTRAQVLKKTPERAVRVRVVHGNLAFASYPVAVGHYRGDTIVSAEKHLDRALQFALTQRLHLGLYPGAIETNAIFSNPQRTTDPYSRPAGAIVVGLGTVGTLSASLLTRSFSRALLEFVLEDRKRRPAGAGQPAAVGVSTLLIGTGAGGMSVSDSVFALVRGAQRANEALAGAQLPDRIGELEFIELYHDRAMLALESLDRLSQRVGVTEAFVLIEDLVSRDGGLHRVTYDEEPEWWQRLQILGNSPADGGSDQALAPLRFAALTRRARTEVRLLPTQRTLVNQFIDRTLATTRHDKAVARTLFDLLLPNELKESAPDQDNLVLLLDEQSARYPWELLENSESRGQGPFAIEHGLLRQLEAREFREQVRGTVERSALVIGDPQSQYVELKGAQAEAEAVCRVLQSSFTSVTKRVRPASQEVITALFERPYRVLHLAGHGVYRFKPAGQEEPVTGMVIGDNTFLTPGEIEQLRTVPELVFINCCHLGFIESGKIGATPQELAFPRLAANLATEFIRIGVRAVIAAGWAVEDVAATTFATTFYQLMLNGETFGEAVKVARKTTYDRHGSSNTWGAYQCYGDPDFRLVLRRDRLAQQQELRFLSPAHVVRDLGNITARLKTHSSMGSDAEIRQLDAIVKAVEKKGWSTGAIHAGLGRAYGEAGRLELAVKYYCSALSTEDGAVTARDVEQWANLTSRLAMERAKTNSGDEAIRAEASTDIRRSIRVLKGLLGGTRGALATSERLALIGSAYKRRAVVDPARRADSLRRMAEYYGKAVATARTRGAGAAYSLVSLRWAELAMRWQQLDTAGIVDGDLAADLEKIRKEIDDREQADGPQFWQDNMRVDCELLEAIARGVPDDETLMKISARYAARRQYASAREFASVCDHLDFLVAMSEQDELTTLALRNLRERLKSSKTPAAQP